MVTNTPGTVKVFGLILTRTGSNVICMNSSKYECSNPFAFREMSFFNDFFISFFKKFTYKKLIELEFRKPILGCYQGTFRDCKSGLPFDCSNHLGFLVWRFL